MRSIVKPLEKNSCGSCALACLTGLRWIDAKAEIVLGRAKRKPDGDPKKRHANPTTGLDLISAAPALGWTATTRCKGLPINESDWATVAHWAGSNPAIVKVHYEDSRMSHWVVWDETGYIYDSNFDSRMDPDEYPYKPLSVIVFKEDDI